MSNQTQNSKVKISETVIHKRLNYSKLVLSKEIHFLMEFCMSTKGGGIVVSCTGYLQEETNV